MVRVAQSGLAWPRCGRSFAIDLRSGESRNAVGRYRQLPAARLRPRRVALALGPLGNLHPFFGINSAGPRPEFPRPARWHKVDRAASAPARRPGLGPASRSWGATLVTLLTTIATNMPATGPQHAPARSPTAHTQPLDPRRPRATGGVGLVRILPTPTIRATCWIVFHQKISKIFRGAIFTWRV